MKKYFSVLLCLAMLLTVCAGCGGNGETEDNPASSLTGADGGSGAQTGGDVPEDIFRDITGIDSSETVVTLAGNTVPADIYFYWLSATCSDTEYTLQNYYMYYGAYSQMFDEAGNLNWDGELMEGVTLRQYTMESAEETCMFMAAIENMAAREGVTLTEEEQAELDAALDSIREQLGGDEAFQQQLAQMGISQESYVRIYTTGMLMDDLTDLVLQEGSSLYLEPAEYDRYATFADHILLSTIDPETNQPLSEEEIAEKYATAQDLLARLQDAEDVPALFTELADEYSEDPGRETNPEGYIYTPGTMVQEFEDAAAALSPGEISGIVETSYGYHILLRKDLTQGLEANQEKKRELAEDYIDELATELIAESETVVSEELDAIDPEAFYTAYTAALAATAGDTGDTGAYVTE